MIFYGIKNEVSSEKEKPRSFLNHLSRFESARALLLGEAIGYCGTGRIAGDVERGADHIEDTI